MTNSLIKEMDLGSEQGHYCDYPLVIVGGAATFALVNTLSGQVVPPSANKTHQQKWKWRNVATSMVHSIITGIWAVSVFIGDPYLTEDLQRKFTASSYSLVCFSIGYFIYDALDMIINHRKRSTYELLLHHSLVVFCYSVAIISKQFVAFVALSLIVEVNSVFLHARQLLIITSEPKHSSRYKINALLNVVTFLVFRIILLSWMTRWMALNRNQISWWFLFVAFVGLGIIDIMNVVLFCRIVYVDMEAVSPFNLSISGTTFSTKNYENVNENNCHTDEKPFTTSNGCEDITENDVCDETFCAQSDEEIISSSINQNYVNSCQKRKEWAPESIVRD